MRPNNRFERSRGGIFVELRREVDDLDKTIADLKKAGVTFTMEPMETPVCHIAIIRDPDNNAVMIHKRKPGHS